MTENKLQKALELKDDITRWSKYDEECEHLLSQWEKLHEKSEEWDFRYVDKKKEWELLTQMVEQSDEVRETAIRNILHSFRVKHRQIRERLAELNRKFSKL